MRRLSILITSLSVFATVPVMACYYDYCEPEMTLDARQCGLAALPFLSPENDTRINLALVLADKGLYTLRPWELPKNEYLQPFTADGEMPRLMQDKDLLPYPETAPPPPAVLGKLGLSDTRWSRISETWGNNVATPCQSNSAASVTAFLEALSEAGLASESARQLAEARLQLAGLCEGDTMPPTTSLPTHGAAGDFTRHLEASATFYSGKFGEAEPEFTRLAQSDNTWIAETANYMLIRAPLNLAQQKAITEWGGLDLVKVDQNALIRAEERTDNYLRLYPKGRYADSARRLYRRIDWLQQDQQSLAKRFVEALQAGESNYSLLMEIDHTLMAHLPPKPLSALPELTLIDQVRHGRRSSIEETDTTPQQTYSHTPSPPNENRLPEESERYLLALEQYEAKNYDEVIAQTRLPANTPRTLLNFSKTMLHGLSLAAMQQWDDAESHWRSELALAHDTARQAVLQLALTITLERADRLATILDPDTPISQPLFRQTILPVASAPMLRKAVTAVHLTPEERRAAHWQLLAKNLTRGLYTDFATDLTLMTPAAIEPDTTVTSPEYGCTSIVSLAARLAEVPQDAAATNCLADFLRQHTDYGFIPQPNSALGGSPDRFGGKQRTSLDLYQQVIASPTVSDNNRAYALSRALSCFATNGSNHCGFKEVPRQQRKRWFTLLKTRYSQTGWARRQQLWW